MIFDEAQKEGNNEIWIDISADAVFGKAYPGGGEGGRDEGVGADEPDCGPAVKEYEAQFPGEGQLVVDNFQISACREIEFYEQVLDFDVT